MTEWCMAHPWLTFWIVITALLVLDNIVTNLIRLGNNVLRVICAKKCKEIPEMKTREGDVNG